MFTPTEIIATCHHSNSIYIEAYDIITLWEFDGLECMSVFKSVTALNHFHQLPIFVLQCGSKIGSYARSGSAVYNFTSIVQLTFFHVSVGRSTHTCTLCTMTWQSHVIFQLLLKLWATFCNVRHRKTVFTSHLHIILRATWLYSSYVYSNNCPLLV